MALQVARGLFRLWLVLTVLWIGIVAVIGWSQLPSALPKQDVADLSPTEDRSIYVFARAYGKEHEIPAPEDS